MKIQVNSDNTIAVDDSLSSYVEGEVSRILDRFTSKLTRVEVHLSDVDNRKTGQADKRCMVEVRPAGARPLSASAKATHVASAVGEALGKMQRSLTTFFGRRGRPATTVSAKVSPAKKAAAAKKATKSKIAKKAAASTRKKSVAKKVSPTENLKLSERRPNKKRIYQARRKPWPSR